MKPILFATESTSRNYHPEYQRSSSQHSDVQKFPTLPIPDKVPDMPPTSAKREWNEGHSQTTAPSSVLESGYKFEDILENLGCFGPFQAVTLFAYLFMEFAAAFVVFMPIFDAGNTANITIACQQEITPATSPATRNVTSPILDVVDLNSKQINESWSVYYAVDLASVPSSDSDLANIINVKSLFKYGSIIEEWNLTCEKAWIPDVFTSCMMAGMIIGNLYASQLADWYGRRKVYLIVLAIMFSGTIMSAFSPAIYVYAIARFISGVGFCGFMNISSMAVMEFMTPRWRSFANCIGPMGEGLMLLSVLAYFIRPWRLLYLVTLVPYIFVIPIYFFLPESPRWLLRNNKLTEAHNVLNYMAKLNGKEPVSMEVLEGLRREEEKTSASLQAKKLGYMEFVRNRKLFVTAMYMFAIWFSWNVSYYGITFNIRNVEGNKYLNVALIGLANAIGQRSSMPVSDRIGRRKAVLFGMLTSASFLVALAIGFLTVEVIPSVVLVVCFFGLLGMSCTRASARLLSGESFPTAVRTMGLGIGSIGANTAGLIIPQVAFLGSQMPALPFFIFATVSVFGSLVVFMMKETNGAPLVDEVELEVARKKPIVSYQLKCSCHNVNN